MEIDQIIHQVQEYKANQGSRPHETNTPEVVENVENHPQETRRRNKSS